MLDVPRGFSDAPLDIYMSEYGTSVAGAGGLPILIPLGSPGAEIVEHLDGLLISGGQDVDPRRYGQSPDPHVEVIDPERDDLEFSLVAAALAAGIPILGICRGHQLLNVALGGTLIQHLSGGEGEAHATSAYPRNHRTHRVDILEDSISHGLYGDSQMVNSFHHQAVDVPGEGLVVTARAPDGVVEAIELIGSPVMGVQWHPETLGADPIFGWLVAEATRRLGRGRFE
ncbi:gamma-glutamyl-gamma-aminobutyrate hydrolase family protein [Mycetocola spongiae]|nr:gamma-glutamyl-gamma-aminobutyrate hydrolase family protein [Mycetocola spongiae]